MVPAHLYPKNIFQALRSSESVRPAGELSERKASQVLLRVGNGVRPRRGNFFCYHLPTQKKERKKPALEEPCPKKNVGLIRRRDFLGDNGWRWPGRPP
jgi:hypothetical protein